MPPIKRRQFLQFTGSLLATLGINQLEIQQQGIRYARVLAENTPRKLALLVGINQYPNSQRFNSLKGCLTDVDLQRELLIHRFGFNPKDILILTDAQATREGILKAFENHLIAQAKPGDVVVFHYSGHGSRVLDPDPISPDKLNSTFVPADDTVSSQPEIVADIMGQTLFLLMLALKTDNVTVVLDCCHAGGGTRGNYRVRAAAGGNNLRPNAIELAYQNQWLKNLNFDRETLTQKRRLGVAKGVVIASAQRNQFAFDVPFNDFHAGAFTYLMTQYLWQESSGISNLIADIRREIKFLSAQVPLVDIQSSNFPEKPVYFINKSMLPVDAVITSVSGNQAKVWLGGLDRETLGAFGQEAVFKDVNGVGEVRLQSRQGLIASGIVKGEIKSGTLLQESVRAIPADLKLGIGLDVSLGNEIEVAKQALSKINRMAAILPQEGNLLDAGEVQYILGRMTASYRQQLPNSSSLPVAGSIGLFSPGLELIPNSFGSAEESVTSAIARLEPKLKALLATRIVKMTLNANSSKLNIEISMHQEGQSTQLVGKAFTIRGTQIQNREQVQNSQLVSQQLPISTPFQFRVKNNESRPLYLSILVLQPDGTIVVLFPNQWRASEETTKLEARESLVIPDPNKDDFQMVTQAKGIGEVLVIASLSPLKRALLKLQTLATELRIDRGFVVPTVEAMNDLLADLSNDQEERDGVTTMRRRIYTTEMAALSITFEVI